MSELRSKVLLVLLLLSVFLTASAKGDATATILAAGSVIDLNYGTLTPLNDQVVNGNSNASVGLLNLDVRGQEISQSFYKYTVNYTGTGTMKLVFISPLIPTVTAIFGIAVSLPGNQEQITYSSLKAQIDTICIVYSGNCGQGSISSPGGGSGGFVPPAISSYLGPSYFVYQIGLIAAIIALIFIIAFARNRRRSSS